MGAQRTVSVRRSFEHPNQLLKSMDKKQSQFYAQNFCLNPWRLCDKFNYLIGQSMYTNETVHENIVLITYHCSLNIAFAVTVLAVTVMSYSRQEAICFG